VIATDDGELSDAAPKRRGLEIDDVEALVVPTGASW